MMSGKVIHVQCENDVKHASTLAVKTQSVIANGGEYRSHWVKQRIHIPVLPFGAPYLGH